MDSLLIPENREVFLSISVISGEITEIKTSLIRFKLIITVINLGPYCGPRLIVRIALSRFKFTLTCKLLGPVAPICYS